MEVYTCVMDMTKAFDDVKHSILFEKLIHKFIRGIYIRLLLVMYDKQYANVKWNRSVSKRFTIRNGVKQGAVLSAILFCVYINDLFKILRKKKSGCWIHNNLFGIIGYADGIFLLSPSFDALQDMIATCENYASLHNLSFSTDVNPNRCKTKCVAFLKPDRVLRNIKLNGRNLPWVTSTKHLGSMIHNNDNWMVRDLMEKRAAYINKNNELMQEFGFAHSGTMIKINNIFNTAIYGSVLWDLFRKEAKRLEKTWNVSQRLMLRLLQKTRRFFIEPLTEPNIQSLTYIKDLWHSHNKLASSEKAALRNLFNRVKRDCRSTTGSNLRNLMLRCNVNSQEEIHSDVLNKSLYQVIPTDNEWEITMAKELIDVTWGNTIIPDFQFNEIMSLLEHITT